MHGGDGDLAKPGQRWPRSWGTVFAGCGTARHSPGDAGIDRTKERRGDGMDVGRRWNAEKRPKRGGGRWDGGTVWMVWMVGRRELVGRAGRSVSCRSPAVIRRSPPLLKIAGCRVLAAHPSPTSNHGPVSDATRPHRPAFAHALSACRPPQGQSLLGGLRYARSVLGERHTLLRWQGPRPIRLCGHSCESGV